MQIIRNDAWLAPIWPVQRPALKLFCFPYAGGTSSVYRSWKCILPPQIAIYAVQLPGRGNRLSEALATRVPDLVKRLVAALRPSLDRPFAFFGHSMGAVLSFELTRYLRRTGNPLPQHLFVSGRRAAHIPDTDPPTYGLSNSEFLESIQRLNGTPQEFFAQPELLELLLPVLRADFELCQTYTYVEEAPLPCPITAFGGTNDPETSGNRLEEWRQQTTGCFSSHSLDGDHFFLHSKEKELLHLLKRELALQEFPADHGLNVSRVEA